jgi:hypothetical protein
MDAERFEAEVASTLTHLIPAPDRAIPYTPDPGEVLYQFHDHHGVPRYIVLRAAGDIWKVVALGRDDQLPPSSESTAPVED